MSASKWHERFIELASRKRNSCVVLDYKALIGDDMKSSRFVSALRLETKPTFTQESESLCKCCGQPYYPEKAWKDKLHAVHFGAERFAVCPACTQGALEDLFSDPAYRRRCVREVRRHQRMYVEEIRYRAG